MAQLHRLFIDGVWRETKERLPVLSPADASVLGQVAVATHAEMEEVCAAMARAARPWAETPALERSLLLRRAAALLRERAEEIARGMTLEQGKPLAEARAEVAASAMAVDWLAEEARRINGQVIGAGSPRLRQMILREPIGPVAAFTPWNFPLHQAARKVASALAAGCPVVLKAAEETPATAVALVRCLGDAGAPAGTVNLLFGVPSEISAFLIAHPVVRKITFTGSTPVGRLLGALAGHHLKPATLELGGHAPVIIADDADMDLALDLLVPAKFRNAGQICIAPTRFIVHESLYAGFVSGFHARAMQIRMGNGLEASTQMGPLANPRRLAAMRELVEDAQALAGEVLAMEPPEGAGWFHGPVIVANAHAGMRCMNEEPFGPLALIRPYETLDEALEEANRLDFGLAAYAFARSAATIHEIGSRLRAGMLAVNHLNVATPELPFGGIGGSGYGTECGPDALAAFLTTKSFSVDCR